jgi:hypothetical protein
MFQSVLDHLSSLYRLHPTFDINAFIVPRSQWPTDDLNRPEQLLVKQMDDALELALVVDDELIEKRSHWSLENLCICVEGVSHLLYLAMVAERDRQVSQLELELQAEIDKFALLLFTTGTEARDLIGRLFLTSEIRDSVVCEEERSRYEEANRLALRYCQYLADRFPRNEQTGPLLSELRRVYRMSGTGKIAYVSECRP